MDIQNILHEAQPGIDLAKGLSEVISANLRMTQLEDLEDRGKFQRILDEHVDKIAFKDPETGFEVHLKVFDMSEKFKSLMDDKNICDMEKPLRTLMELATAQQKEYIRGEKIIIDEGYKKKQMKKNDWEDGTQIEVEEEKQNDVNIDRMTNNIDNRRRTLEGYNLMINGVAPVGVEEQMQTHFSNNNNNNNQLVISPESRNQENNNGTIKPKGFTQAFLMSGVWLDGRQQRKTPWNFLADESDYPNNDQRQWQESIMRQSQLVQQESILNQEGRQEVEEEVKEDLEDMPLVGSSANLRLLTNNQPIYNNNELPIIKSSQKPKANKPKNIIANSLRAFTCLMTLCYGIIGIAESYRESSTLNKNYDDYQIQGIAGYLYIFLFAVVIALSLLSLKHPRSTIIYNILVLNLPLASVFYLVSLTIIDVKSQYVILFTYGMLLTLLILFQILSETDIIDGLVEFFHKAMR